MITASKQADGWLCGNIVDTPYGDGKVLHVHGRDSADLIIQVRIVTPRSSNPSYRDCLEDLQNTTAFFTREFGWECCPDYLSRLVTTEPDDASLSPEERGVLVALRKSAAASNGFFGNSIFGDPVIDQQGVVWCPVDLGQAKPRETHGRDFVKQVRALEKAGLYLNTNGSYALARRCHEFIVNGFVRISGR